MLSASLPWPGGGRGGRKGGVVPIAVVHQRMTLKCSFDPGHSPSSVCSILQEGQVWVGPLTQISPIREGLTGGGAVARGAGVEKTPSSGVQPAGMDPHSTWGNDVL